MALTEALETARNNLENNSNTREYDCFVKGVATAYREMLEWEPNLDKDEDDNLQPEESGT